MPDRPGWLNSMSRNREKTQKKEAERKRLIKDNRPQSNGSQSPYSVPVHLQDRDFPNHTPIIRDSQEELGAIGKHVVHFLREKNFDVSGYYNRPRELVGQLFTFADTQHARSNSLESDLQQRFDEIQRFQEKLNENWQTIQSIKHENTNLQRTNARLAQEKETQRQAFETQAQTAREQYDEHILNLTRQHENQAMSMKANYLEKMTQFRQDYDNTVSQHDHKMRQLESSYKHQMTVMTANHESFLASEAERQNRELEQLKKWAEKKVDTVEMEMRMSVDNFQAKPDRTVTLSFEELRSAVRKLSRSPIKAGLHELGEVFGERCPPQPFPEQDYKLVLQSYLWRLIIEGVFITPFRVYGAYGDVLAESWALLFDHNTISANHEHTPMPNPDLVAEKWRYTTIERLQKALKAKQPTRPSDRQIVKSYHENAVKLEQRLASSMARIGAKIEEGAIIRTIVNAACDFALCISIERCRIQVFVPPTGRSTVPGAEGTIDASTSNGSGAAHRTAQLVIEPGLLKSGNARGGALHNRTFLSKAAVYFREGSEDAFSDGS